jgi:hypothetical protein
LTNALLKKWRPGKVSVRKKEEVCRPQIPGIPTFVVFVCDTHRALDAARSPAEIYGQPQDLLAGAEHRRQHPAVQPRCWTHRRGKQGGGGWVCKPAFLAGSEHKQQKIGGQLFGLVKFKKYQLSAVAVYKKPEA